MKPSIQSTVLLMLYGLGAGAGAQSAALSEKDYLDDVPVVLSVSRLPQRLDETPGAVTLIDRQMIRMSGARDVADLLRLVPGFRVTNSFESNTPQGSYHSALSDYSNHIQVMVDGRSVYSTYLRGGTGPGLQTVALQDIERIEVYRGSNSAAYGARAFLGSINIITRDPVDTQGVMAQVSRGGNDIEDQMLRVGWGDERARFRLSADGRNDAGLPGASGSSRVQRFNLRADLRGGPHDLVELRAGQSLIDAGVGFTGDANNNARTRRIETSFLQMDWRRSLDADQDVLFQASYTAESIRDAFVYTPLPSLTVDFGGRASNSNLLAQHTVRLNPALRLVWGGELRRETIRSRPFYNTDAALVTNFSRLFTNIEWRLRSDLILNAGALFEHSSIDGGHASPRLMLNWQLAEGHTLRAGVSRAFRPPSTFEKYANVRYFSGGTLLESTYVSSGRVVSEKVEVRELGYLAELVGSALTLDVRVFDERVRDFIGEKGDIPQAGSGGDGLIRDYLNNENFRIQGHEAQLNWKPWSGGRLIYGLSQLNSTQSYGAAPVGHYATQSLMYLQQLPAGVALSLAHSEADAGYYPGFNQPMPAVRRTDLRLAKALRVAGHAAELALVGQNLGSPYPDFRPEFRYPQRIFVQLRVEH